MERTRIVHYTHSRTPVVLSPTSPTTPRLSTSSSLSSLVSSTQDKAPLACIDTECPSTPRRASKSGTNARSSSTGRLLDDPKLETSIYTALRCQDYPSPVTSVKRRESHGNTDKERPHSTFTPVHTPDTDDANRRHTLGSWSRSRRKSQTESPNLSSKRHNTTLPRTMSDASSSGTLVKSRRRYTWLSPKQTNSQVPPATVAMRKQNTNDGDSLSPTSPEDIPDQPRTTNPRPQTIMYNWKTDPRRRPCHFGDAFDLSPPHTPSQSPPHTPPQTPPQTPPKHIHGTRRTSDQVYTKRSTSSDNTPYEAISSSDAGNSSETCFYSKTLPAEKCNTSFRSYPHHDGMNHPDPYNNMEQPIPYNATEHPTSCNAIDYHPAFSNNSIYYPTSSSWDHLDSHNGVDHLHAQNGDMGHANLNSEGRQESAHDDKTPVEEFSSDQCLSESILSTVHVAHTNYDNKDPVRCVQDGNSLKERCYDMSPQRAKRHDCLVRSSFHGDFKTYIPQKKNDVNKSNSFHNDGRRNDLSISSKNVPMLSGSAVKVPLDKRSAMSKPRNRNSLRMALQDYDSWLDLTLETGSSSNISETYASVGGSQKNEIVFPEAIDKPKRNQISKEDEIFVSCNDLISNERAHLGNGAIRVSDYPNYQSSSMCRLTVGGGEGVEDQSESNKDDTLTRRIKRNSMRLATASLSDLTCAIDDIDINQEDSRTSDTEQQRVEDVEIPRNISLSPIKEKTNLSRTSSLLSSQHSSSFGSFYSCQSMDAILYKKSPSSNASHRNELRARFDSPMTSRFNRNVTEQSSWDASNPRVSITRTRTSSPTSTASSPISRTSSDRIRPSHRPVYFWTRQSPYPRLLYTASGSAASLKSSEYRPSSPQPSLTLPSLTNNNSAHQHSDSAMSLPRPCRQDDQDSRTSLDKDLQSSLQIPSGSSCRPIDRRSLTLPISAPLCPGSNHPHSHRLSDYYPPYASDLPPLDVGDYSPDSNSVRSPPSLGRPRRKVYAGFDSQPLPMDSFMSDSSSVYTGVSCSSRATDMTGQPDGSQFDESFISDVRSVYEGDSRGDISFDPSQTLLSSMDGSHHGGDENVSKHGSMHSTSTTKHGNGDSSVEEKSRDGSSLHNVSDDDLIDNSNDNVSNKFCKQFGSEYDALFRLYKSDDVIGKSDMITSPSHHFYLQNGKAFSSSCLLRSTLYSKRKFFSSRDIFDLFGNSEKASLDGTVSLTSLERHAHKVCEAILCCDEMDQGYIGKEAHSLV